jgi:hypothetical protein
MIRNDGIDKRAKGMTTAIDIPDTFIFIFLLPILSDINTTQLFSEDVYLHNKENKYIEYIHIYFLYRSICYYR